jgi:hypothetical protein
LGQSGSDDGAMDMTRRLKDKLLDVLSAGNRPIRIFFFGGALLAYSSMKILGKILGVETDSSGDVDLPGVILMMISILIGFAASYGILRLLENNKRHSTEDSP